MLDTGASHTTFSPTAFFDIGLNPNAATRTAEVTTASNRHEVPVLTIHRLDCLGQSVTELDVNCMNFPPQLQIDGLLGLNFLRHFKLYLNLPKGILVIHERSPKNFSRRLVQLFELIKAYW